MATGRRQTEWMEKGPGLLLGCGLGLFWAACIWSDSLPVEAFLVGPGLMIAAAILIARFRL
jgi:hypothetical protein